MSSKQRDVTTMFSYSKELRMDWDSKKWRIEEYDRNLHQNKIVKDGFASKKEALSWLRRK